jgi:hypothetical protein
MKLTIKNKYLTIGILAIVCLSTICPVESLGVRKANNIEKAETVVDKVNTAMETERHKSKSHKAHLKVSEAALGAPTFNATNKTLTKSLYHQLNETFVKQDMNTFKQNNRKWVDNKLFDKQLEDIYHDMLYQQNQEHTPASTRASIQIFTTAFEGCDINKDNVLNETEFTLCMNSTDKYLMDIVPPPSMFATFANYTNATGFYPVLFNVLDTYNTGYLNFHDYMILRLMVFSWRKCSVLGPFIEEISFECAIEIASSWKTMSRTTSRKIYLLALELSNSPSARNLDFIAFFIVATSVRFYGKINNKEDSDATKSEFALGLDSNYLPSRYNQDIINQMFALVEEYNKPAQGMDIVSFCYYDFILRLFDKPNPAQKYYMNLTEFQTVFTNYLFPSGILNEVSHIPSNNITAASYQMYAYLNISNYHQESDHFVKFLQKTEKKSKSKNTVALKRGKASPSLSINSTNVNTTSQFLFHIIDGDNDGWINYYDFANFIQIAYFFDRLDKDNKGYILAGNLYDAFTTYSEYPAYNYKIRERAKRFNLLNQDLFIDLQRAVLILKLEDIVSKIVRRSDPTTLFEYELKTVFSQVNLANVPQSHLDKCLRGTDDNNVPRYDWECATLEAITMTANYYDWALAYKGMQSQNLTMANTVFVNPDPALAA